MPQFSVVIPAYNAARFVAAALDSVAGQTFRDFEIVVVDDGSSDDTAARVTSWREHHHDIELELVSQPNKGIGGSRNSGIRKSRGEFVAFLDVDDTWMPEKLASVATFLGEHPEVDLVCHHEWMDRGNGALRRLSHGPHASYEDLLFKGNTISTSAVTVRRTLLDRIGGFSEDLSINGVEDYDLWLRLARSGCRIAYLPEVLGTYRVHDTGFTANIDAHLSHTLNVLHAHFDALPGRNYKRQIRKARAIAFRGAARAYMTNGRRSQARQMFHRSIAEWPLGWRSWTLMVANEIGIRA